jgi:rfaE bifunctional protein nucleotidyltransferase chain/domain
MSSDELAPYQKIRTVEEAAQLSATARAAGQRVVLTNGCFDILHAGHVRYLRRARALGDILIVGVNSDESVRRLKGPGRPINTAADRMEVLAALAVVDYVTVFDGVTATELVQAVQPTVYVKGGDYSDDPADTQFPIEGHTVLEHGGQVRIIRFEPGYSTSQLVAKIQGLALDSLRAP